MFGREPKTKLPELQSEQHDDNELRQTDYAAKRKMKSYADKRNQAKQRNITAGDVVLVKQPKENKFSTPYGHTPLIVRSTKGTMVIAEKPNGSIITRNAAMFRRIQPKTPPADQDEDFNADKDTSNKFEGIIDITTDEDIADDDTEDNIISSEDNIDVIEKWR